MGCVCGMGGREVGWGVGGGRGSHVEERAAKRRWSTCFSCQMQTPIAYSVQIDRIPQRTIITDWAHPHDVRPLLPILPSCLPLPFICKFKTQIKAWPGYLTETCRGEKGGGAWVIVIWTDGARPVSLGTRQPPCVFSCRRSTDAVL